MRRALKHSMMSKIMDKETMDNIITEYFDRQQLRQEIYNGAIGEMLLFFAGFQRIHEKRGKKKITETVEAFVTFCNDMAANKSKYEHIISMLKDETGYDFNEHSKTFEFRLSEQDDG